MKTGNGEKGENIKSRRGTLQEKQNTKTSIKKKRRRRGEERSIGREEEEEEKIKRRRRKKEEENYLPQQADFDWGTCLVSESTLKGWKVFKTSVSLGSSSMSL